MLLNTMYQNSKVTMKQLQNGLTSIFLSPEAITSLPQYVELGLVYDNNKTMYLAAYTTSSCKLFNTDGFYNEIIKEPGKEFNFSDLKRFHDFNITWELSEYDYLPDELFDQLGYGLIANHYWVIGKLLESVNETYCVIQTNNILQFYEDQELVKELIIPEGTSTVDYLKKRNLVVISPGG
jgi:hypothetical protein